MTDDPQHLQGDPYLAAVIAILLLSDDEIAELCEAEEAEARDVAG